MWIVQRLILLFIIIDSAELSSQTSVSGWCNYSLQNLTVTSGQERLSAPNDNRDIYDPGVLFYDDLDQLQSSINAVHHLNSSRTIFGSQWTQPILSTWDIYKDYHFMDAYDYWDMDY